MKKFLSLLVACALILSGCGQNRPINIVSETKETTEQERISDGQNADEEIIESQEPVVVDVDDEDADPTPYEYELIKTGDVPEFDALGDPRLLQYVEDTIYTGLIDEFQSEDYIIENVKAIYFSKEYIDELAYNSKANIWFGYTLEELDGLFNGMPYVFTLGDDGETTVVPFDGYNDVYNELIHNVAIGTGIILVCVTVSVITGVTGITPVSMVFAASAKTGTAMAVSSGAFSAIFAGAITGVQTKDFGQAVQASALAASDGFKWGAITGVLVGGVTEINTLHKAAGITNKVDNTTIAEVMDDLPEWRKAELRALSNYGGTEQVTYLAGEEVPFGTPGATRPDVVREAGGHLEAIEVKYYNLGSES